MKKNMVHKIPDFGTVYKIIENNQPSFERDCSWTGKSVFIEQVFYCDILSEQWKKLHET